MSGGAPALRRRETVLAALFFFVLTVLMTWPQAARLSTGLNDLWDAKQNAWILHWDFVQTLRDPANLFQAPILHPARYALAFSENLYGAAVFGFPLLAAGVAIIPSYNVVFLLGMAFSAWAAWLLARHLTRDPAASLLAGLVFAFVPWRFAQLPHINMQWGGFLCLLLLFLLRYLEQGRLRDLILFAACFAGNLLATLHFGLFSGFLIGWTLAYEAVVGGPGRARRILMSGAAAAAATLVCLPFLIPYTIAAKLYGMRRGLEEMAAFSAVPADFLSAGARNRLYGAWTQRWSRGEADFFPGLVPVALAAVGVFAARRPRRRLDPRTLLLLGVGALGVVIALGAHTPFYRFLFVHVGSVFRAIRVPARAIVLFHLSLGVLAAWGLSAATQRLRPGPRAACIAGALALVGFEYRAFPLELHHYDSGPRAPYEWLRTSDLAGAVVEWPIGFPYDCEAMLRQAEHGRPLVNGHQSYFPPEYRQLVTEMGKTPIDPTAWTEISRLGAATLVFHVEPGRPYELVRYRRFLRQGIEDGRAGLAHAFREADARVFVFRLGEGVSGGADPESQRELERLLAPSDAELAPPTGLIHAPSEGQTVAPGFWGFGWAVDDSGIAAVEVGSELGRSGLAQLGGKWPGLAETFPDFPEAAHGGYGFPVPDLTDGPHTLRISLVGRDGGRTVLERHIVVARAAH